MTRCSIPTAQSGDCPPKFGLAFARPCTHRLASASALCLFAALFTLGPAHSARADATEMEACVAAHEEAPKSGSPARGNEHFEELTDDQVSELLRFTKQSLKDQRLGASLWWSGWVAFNIGNVSAGAWKIATVPSHLERDTWMMSTIGAGLFLLGAAIMPLPGLYANLRMQRLPETTPSQRREKLKRGLLLLERAAIGEDRNSNLTAHLGGLVFALFSTGFIYFHNPHAERSKVWLAAGLQLGASIVGTEATLWSVPRKARRDVVLAKAHACGAKVPPKSAAAPLRALSLSASPVYLGLRLSF